MDWGRRRPRLLLDRLASEKSYHQVVPLCAAYGGTLDTPETDPLVEQVLEPMRELLARYRRLAVRLDSAIASLTDSLERPTASNIPATADGPQLARLETPTGDLGTLLDFQERLSELDGVLKVTVAGSAGGRSTFLVELANADDAPAHRVVCSNCGKVMSEGIDPPSHGLCDDCRERFGGRAG